LSMLNRGATPGGIMNINPPVDFDTFKKMQDEIQQGFAGATNAGKIMLLNGLGDFTSTTMNNKDMDFLNLKKDIVESIYNKLKIPLSMISATTMTMDNFKMAPIQFYHRAVLPIAKRVFNEITRFLLPMYGIDTTKIVLSYNQGDIPALEPLRNEQLMTLKNLEIFTINQLRAECGADPLDGGNVIYGAQMDVPIATDPNDNSVQIDYNDMPNLENVGGNDEKLGSKPKTTRAKFTETLSAKTDKDGNPLFTEEEINQLADKHGLQ